MRTLLIQNADCIATFSSEKPGQGTELRHASLFIRGNQIEAIGPAVELPQSADEVIDARHHLVIAGGKGWLYEETLAEVERQGLQERVHFLGFVADTDLPALYTQATLVLFPSFYEGFGLPALAWWPGGVVRDASNKRSRHQ